MDRILTVVNLILHKSQILLSIVTKFNECIENARGIAVPAI
jgi:hypothetical protein